MFTALLCNVLGLVAAGLVPTSEVPMGATSAANAAL